MKKLKIQMVDSFRHLESSELLLVNQLIYIIYQCISQMNEEYRRELEDAVKRSEEYIRELQKEEVKRFEERQEEMLSQEKQDAELARRLAKEEPDAVVSISRAKGNYHLQNDLLYRYMFAGTLNVCLKYTAYEHTVYQLLLLYFVDIRHTNNKVCESTSNSTPVNKCKFTYYYNFAYM